MSRPNQQRPSRYLGELAAVAALFVALYALWFLVASPIGEFPLNDDWAYAYSARHLLNTGQLKLSQWTSATIIFQVYLGSLVAWLSGGFSFTALRLTALVVSLLGCVAAYDLFRELRLPISAALLGALVIATNPVFMYLSYTFMSDIFFLSLMLVSVSLYTRGIRMRSNRVLLVASIAAALAYLSRQLGIFLPVAGALALALKEKRLSWQSLLSIGLIPVVVVIAHVGWLRFVHGFPWALQAHMIDESFGRLFTRSEPVTLWHEALATLLYLGLFTLPALVAQAVRPCLPREQLMRLGVSFAVWLIILGIFAVISGVAMPYLPNVINRQGLGPTPWDKFHLTPNWVFGLVTVVAPVAGALQGALWTDAVATAWRHRAGPGVTLILAGVLCSLVTGIAVILWDEYLLVFVPAALFLVLRLGPISGRQWAAAVPIIIATMVYGILEMGEYMAWNAARWTAGQKLVSQGISPERIDGGFEWVGWHEFDEKAPRAIAAGLPFRPYWAAFVARKSYVLSFSPIKDHTIIDKEEYRTPLLGYYGTIYVLRKPLK